jgi:FtsP/CotA-like multicopper oxidase with cupredoxin domain/plastocyanin
MEFDFEYDIPSDHPTGLFWYHPHFHGQAEKQVEMGLAGAIVIAEDPNEGQDLKGSLLGTGARYPGPPAEERLLIFQKVDGFSTPLLVNGQDTPQITIRSGEEQRWQLLNASAKYFVNLVVDGHMLTRLAVDGNWIPNYRELDPLRVIALGPAERAEVLIKGVAAEPETEFAIRSVRNFFRNKPFFDWELPEDPVEREAFLANASNADRLATLKIQAGAAPATPKPMPEPVEAIPCVRSSAAPPRVITFTSVTTIDGKEFSEGRVDQTVNCDATEIWRIFNQINATEGWHPFHLHVNDFDVLRTSTDPEELQPAFYQDTIPLPPAVPIAEDTDGNCERNKDNTLCLGSVEICSKFADFTGKFVYHCHFLHHEDDGMMGVVEVVKPVAITAAAIDQPTLPVVLGTTVVWTNVRTNEDAADSYTIVATDGSFNSGPIGPGQSYAYTFDVPGDVGYCCLPTGPGPIPASCPESLSGVVEVASIRTIDITDDGGPGTIKFHPPTLTSPPITAGTTVVWTNRDSVPHTVTAEGVFASGPIAPDATFEHTVLIADMVEYAGDVPALPQPVIAVRPPRPVVTVWIESDGFSHAQQALEQHLDEEQNRKLYIPPGTLVTWTNRSGINRNIMEVVAPGERGFDSGSLDPERDPPLDSENPPGPDDPAKPRIPGQRFSHRFEDLGIVSYRSMGEEGVPQLDGLVYVVTPVEIIDFAFVPETIEVPVGTPVSWVNRGAVPHTVTAEDTAYGGVPAYSSEALASGTRFTRTFDTPGVYPYRCAIHEGMTGTVIVRVR